MARAMSRKKRWWCWGSPFLTGLMQGSLLLLALAMLVFGLSSMGGCGSATKSIADAAVEVSRRSEKIAQHVAAARSELASPPEEVPVTKGTLAWTGSIDSHLVAIGHNAVGIADQAAIVSTKVTQVEDKVPWWAALLKLLAWVAGLGIVAWLLWTTGIGAIIKKFLWGLGWFIPKAKVSSAKLDAEALADPSKLPQAIASRRTIDPAYDAAFRAEKAKLEGEGA